MIDGLAAALAGFAAAIATLEKMKKINLHSRLLELGLKVENKWYDKTNNSSHDRIDARD